MNTFIRVSNKDIIGSMWKYLAAIGYMVRISFVEPRNYNENQF